MTTTESQIEQRLIHKLTDAEFARLRDQIVTSDVFTAARTLRYSPLSRPTSLKIKIGPIVKNGHFLFSASPPKHTSAGVI